MAKKAKKAKKKKLGGKKRDLALVALTAANPAGDFLGTLARTISRDEIYHRLEWYFDRAHNPHGQHTIPPSVPIGALLHGVGLDDLYVNLSRASPLYVPAWQSPLFHGVVLPWVSAPPNIIGVKDVKNMGDLIDCLVVSYKHAGWQVIGA